MTTFQSSLPRGERPKDVVVFATVKEISILAPARGATCIPHHSVIQVGAYFNPRSREGSDEIVHENPRLGHGFQSSLPRGERQESLSDKLATGNKFQSSLPRGERRRMGWNTDSRTMHFNPRSREGSDGQVNMIISLMILFQSSLPRGERHFTPDQLDKFLTISILAPARGATQ